VEEITYRLINGRYEAMRPSIFVSNLPTEDFKSAVGDRIASRLAETCVRVALTGPDRRRQVAA
jgi:DNA replication protein DnaC